MRWSPASGRIRRLGPFGRSGPPSPQHPSWQRGHSAYWAAAALPAAACALAGPAPPLCFQRHRRGIGRPLQAPLRGAISESRSACPQLVKGLEWQNGPYARHTCTEGRAGIIDNASVEARSLERLQNVCKAQTRVSPMAAAAGPYALLLRHRG